MHRWPETGFFDDNPSLYSTERVKNPVSLSGVHPGVPKTNRVTRGDKGKRKKSKGKKSKKAKG
jgi:hypothetical protein